MTTGISTLPTCSLPPLAQTVFHLVAESDNMCCFAIQLESYRSLIVIVLSMKVCDMLACYYSTNKGGTTRAASMFWSWRTATIQPSQSSFWATPFRSMVSTTYLVALCRLIYRPLVVLRGYLLLVPLLACLLWPPWASSVFCIMEVAVVAVDVQSLSTSRAPGLPPVNGGGDGVAKVALQSSLEAYR